jgi:DNA invertase Pin-like site-specific DNA recombinase/ssDNA-binding Zn-finger/Zn-ribbon topoisomerase 1
MRDKKYAALYLRLSRDDGADAESNSIGNQRDMLTKYAKENGLVPFLEYVDDGHTGTNFDRPAFKRMLADIEAGMVDTVVCKDLSRFGRHNALVAMYTEIWFPERDIRFIAAYDGIDTAKGEDDLMPFRSVINEFYAKDISTKCRSVKKNSAMRGDWVGGSTPYGYERSNGKLVINWDEAVIVKRIFSMALDGDSMYKIATTLSREGIPTMKESRKEVVEPQCRWSVPCISYMLRNRVYIGETVGQKFIRKSYKIKRMVRPPESEWIVIPDTHEALVDVEEFRKLQDWLSEASHYGKRSGRSNPLFNGLLYCSDCGRRLAYFQPRYGYYYACSGHFDMHYRGKSRPCSPHYIREDKLSEAVMHEINRVLSQFDQHEYIEAMDMKAKMSTAQKRLDVANKRDEELNVIIKRMIEQNAKGALDNTTFEEFIQEYQDERFTIEQTIRECASILRANPAANAKQFDELIKDMDAIEILTREDVLKLVEKIVVHESNGERREGRQQLIDVHFRHVGAVGEALMVA